MSALKSILACDSNTLASYRSPTMSSITPSGSAGIRALLGHVPLADIIGNDTLSIIRAECLESNCEQWLASLLHLPHSNFANLLLDDDARLARYIMAATALPQFQAYTPSVLAMGSLMLARFLLGEGRTPFGVTEQAVEVMVVLDRHFRQMPSWCPRAGILDKFDLKYLWVDMYVFYTRDRDALPEVPLSLEEYKLLPLKGKLGTAKMQGHLRLKDWESVDDSKYPAKKVLWISLTTIFCSDKRRVRGVD